MTSRMFQTVTDFVLTVVLLAEVGRGFQEVLEECGVYLLHGQILNAVRVPVHVVPNALKGVNRVQTVQINMRNGD